MVHGALARTAVSAAALAVATLADHRAASASLPTPCPARGGRGRRQGLEQRLGRLREGSGVPPAATALGSICRLELGAAAQRGGAAVVERDGEHGLRARLAPA